MSSPHISLTDSRRLMDALPVSPLLNHCGSLNKKLTNRTARPQNGKSNWWVDPGDPSANVAAFIQVKRPKNPSKPQEGWCGSGQPTANPEEDDDYTLNAATQISQNYIYFCANGMNFPRTQAGQQVTVDHNDPTKSTSLTEMKSLSRTMFHEFNHL